VWAEVLAAQQGQHPSLARDPGATLTVTDHPVLGRPFFQLHPCHTADLMAEVMGAGAGGNYVRTWLSLLGPVVGLAFPLELLTLDDGGRPPEAPSSSDIVRVPKGHLARLLYANPVCLLSVRRGAQTNVMTISWLTPINNEGTMVCSMKATRYTAELLQSHFVLSVPCEGMQELVARIGSCSGASTDKVSSLGIPMCEPGWAPTAAAQSKADRKLERALQGAELTAVASAVAHVVCSVQARSEVQGHLLLTCAMEAGWVRSRYWDGRIFAPRDPSVPPYLTFFGSQCFGVSLPLDQFHKLREGTGSHRG
jgi:flavin reductase (DIM6/NTAB) family NADH-FMN oxidoreductase RutF